MANPGTQIDCSSQSEGEPSEPEVLSNMIINDIVTTDTPELLVIWDFDQTIILNDSEHASINGLDPSLIKSHLHNGALVRQHGWRWVTNQAYQKLFDKGHSAYEIVRSAVTNTTLPSETAQIIRNIANTEGAKNAIASDSNTSFIHDCIQSRGLSPSVHFQAGIFTNVANVLHYEGNRSKLVVTPYSQAVRETHNCHRCQSNICKSLVVKRILARYKRRINRIIYVGDGFNDFCAAVTLSERNARDVVLYRTGFGLEKALQDRAGDLSYPLRLYGWKNVKTLVSYLNSFFELDAKKNRKVIPTKIWDS